MQKENNKKVGFTIGKFAPFHKGHQYVIETALKEMDKVIVVVYDTDKIDIPTEKRAEWIKSKYPSVEIKFAHDPPSQYGLDQESVNVQMSYLTKIMDGEKPTHFYSSEMYGKSVAEYMNISDRRVDMERIAYPISASIIRADLDNNKKWLEENVYHEVKNNNKSSK